MKTLKQILVLNVLMLNHAYLTSMQNVNLNVTPAGTFPVSVWQEIAKTRLIKENGTTEAEIFANTDRLTKLGGNAARAVTQLVSQAGIDKGKKNYTYSDFKADIMQEMLVKRAKKIVPLAGKSTTKVQFDKLKKQIRDEAIKAQAFNWSRNRIKDDKKLQDELNILLIQEIQTTSLINLNKIETLLKLGADPNNTKWRGPDAIYIMPALNFIMLTLEPHIFKADFNKIIKLVDLLLKHNANPNLHDELIKMSALDNAKKTLSYWPSSWSKPDIEKLKIETLKEIIKLFEEAIKKQG